MWTVLLLLPGITVCYFMSHLAFHEQPLFELHIKNKLAPPPAHGTGTFPVHPWTHFLLLLSTGGCHLMLSSNELLPCWWAVFSGEREVRKKPTVLSHFNQSNHDKTLLTLCALQSPFSTLLTQPWHEAPKKRRAWAAAEMPPFLFLPTQMICFTTQHSRALGN